MVSGLFKKLLLILKVAHVETEIVRLKLIELISLSLEMLQYLMLQVTSELACKSLSNFNLTAKIKSRDLSFV